RLDADAGGVARVRGGAAPVGAAPAPEPRAFNSPPGVCSTTPIASARKAESASADIHRIRSSTPFDRVISGQPPCRTAVTSLVRELAAGLSRKCARPLALRPRLTTGLP